MSLPYCFTRVIQASSPLRIKFTSVNYHTSSDDVKQVNDIGQTKYKLYRKTNIITIHLLKNFLKLC